MISKVELGSVDKKNNRQMQSIPQNPSFTGMGEWALKAIQVCEKRPMVNVAVLDLSTAILPRTFFETFIGSKQKDENGNELEKRHLNLLGGFEAFRRESSGLIINCLIPSFIVIGVAKFLRWTGIMGDFKASNLTRSWANGDAIKNIEKYYQKAEVATKKEDRIFNALKGMFDDIEGVDGDVEKGGLKKFKDIFAGDAEYTAKIREMTQQILSDKPKKGYADEMYKYMVEKSGIAENIRFAGETGFSSSNLSHLCESAGDILHGAVKEGIIKDYAENVVNEKGLKEVAKAEYDVLGRYLSKAKKLVNSKSIGGLGIIIPLAIAAQPINRWITHKMAGKKGAPIYNDDQERILTPEEKKKLTAEKFVAVPLMWAVAALSMLMDRPSLKMFQFKNIFPTMDQARIISAATFSSRIAASEDSNELKENTIRDIATFSSFYFLGDYAAKGIATYLENHNKDGIKLTNKLKTPKPDANVLERFWAWAKHTKMKSSDELMHIADEALRTKARNMRASCQLGNLFFSLLALGVFIPLYTRTQTNKKKQQEKEKLAAMLSSKPPVQFTQRFQDTSPAFQSFSISKVQ
jgi:hypothetical protein